MTIIEYGQQKKNFKSFRRLRNDLFTINNSIQSMPFKIAELKKFLFSIHKRKMESINIQSSNLTLSISTTKHKNQKAAANAATSQIISINNHRGKSKYVKKANQSEQIVQKQNTYFTIVSPMIGTFYRSPAPNEKPFININDSVKTNQTVCIIEAMKLMNEIESEVNGSIAEILVEDGDIVDCGQALMRVKQK